MILFKPILVRFYFFFVVVGHFHNNFFPIFIINFISGDYVFNFNKIYSFQSILIVKLISLQKVQHQLDFPPEDEPTNFERKYLIIVCVLFFHLSGVHLTKTTFKHYIFILSKKWKHLQAFAKLFLGLNGQMVSISIFFTSNPLAYVNFSFSF